MKLFRAMSLMGLLFCASLIAGALSPQANADQWNKKTHVTFNAPVEIPGFHGRTVLPAGTYTFKLLDSSADRHIVQIFNKGESHLYATILAIPDYRLQPTGKTVIKFQETAANTPEALKAWFYPGDNFGQEFVYPKARAVELAKASNEPVLSMPEESAENINKPIKSAKEPAVAAMENAEVKAEKPSGEEEAMNEAVTTTPPSGSSTTMAKNEASTLPKTASDMPLAALCGLLLLGMGFAIRLFSRRFAQPSA
jgi:hypothetical protein